MKFYIIDAFTETIFGGNPAGIVLLGKGSEFPAEAVMLSTAAELRYSETAFIKQISDKEFELKYFTPASEVDFCGHATVAAFTALLKCGLARKNTSCLIHTLSGDLIIDLTEDIIMMGMPASKLIKHIDAPGDISGLYATLGIDYEPVTVTDCEENTVELLPILISTGFPDIFVPVKDREALSKIAPDFKALADFTEKHGAGGAHAFTLDAPEADITACCRNFAPLYEIDEEAATGTASGGLTYYLHIHGLAPSGHDCRFLQGEAMGRPSMIITSVDVQNETTAIKVGGKGVILAEGEINL